MRTATALRSGLHRLTAVRRLGWGVADQAVSSVENFVLGVFVARTMGAQSLGAMSLALITYALVVAAARGLATDPLMVRFSAVGVDRWRVGVRAAIGTGAVVGVLAGVVMLASALAARSVIGPGELVATFIALAVGLPGLVIQDGWRSAFFAAGRGAQAFLNDLAWTLLLFGVLAVMWGQQASAPAAVLAYGLTATVAAVLGSVQARTLPRARLFRRWLHEQRDLGPRFLVENVTLGASGSVRSYAVAGTSGLSAAGGVRGAEMLIGPVAALLMGISQVAIPEVARWLPRGRQGVRRVTAGISLGLASVSVVWGLVLLVVFPLGPGSLLLGDVWPAAQALLPAVVVSVTLGCTQVGPSAALRALGRADRSMRTQIFNSVVFIVLGVVGALGWGAQGAVWGSAVAAGVGGLTWWRQFALAERWYFANATPTTRR
jgi:O-antigen/teichoic acid export membrane protein